MTDTPCTADDRERIVAAARERTAYLLWLADKLVLTSDVAIRAAAAKELRHLFAPPVGRDADLPPGH